MEEQKKDVKQPELTKEQLKEVADKLFNENKWLRQQNQQMNQVLMGFERLDYLLRVINTANSCKNYSFDIDFVQRCIDEVQKVMTPPEDDKTTEETKLN